MIKISSIPELPHYRANGNTFRSVLRVLLNASSGKTEVHYSKSNSEMIESFNMARAIVINTLNVKSDNRNNDCCIIFPNGGGVRFKVGTANE